MENKIAKRIKHFLIMFALILSFAGSLYLAWYHVVDGELVRKPVTFGVDIQNIQMTKDVYKRGDEIEGLFKFCKNRPAKAYVIPVIYNDEVKTLTSTPVSGLPVGCYPKNGEYAKFKFGTIPVSVSRGEHWIGGYIVEILPTGKEIRIPFRTESFIVE